jgi:hypothetical protein
VRRFLIVLLLAALVAPACGGKSEPTGDQGGISALQGSENDNGPAATEAGDQKKERDDNDKGSHKGGAKQDESKDDAATDPGGDSSGSGDDGGGSGGDAQSGGDAPQAHPAVAVPAGTYGYSTDGQTTVSGNSHPMPDRTTLSAQAPRSGEQRDLRDLRDGDGNGQLIETHLLYKPEGVYLTYLKVTSTFPGGLTDVREFDIPKPQPIAPTGVGPGYTQSFSVKGSGTRADVTLKALRREKVTIGGSSVTTLVVDTKIVFSGSLKGEQHSTSWFWGKHVLAVKEQVHTDVTNGPIRVQSDYEAVLEHLP